MTKRGSRGRNRSLTPTGTPSRAATSDERRATSNEQNRRNTRRSRTGTLPKTPDHGYDPESLGVDMPEQDAVSEWMNEVTERITEQNGRLQAVEKTVDEMKMGPMKDAREALQRIAKVEEDRLKHEAKIEEDRARRESSDSERRDKWFERIFSSSWFQLLMVGLVVAALNVLGVAWVSHLMLPAAP
jgi:hypothetical protein